MVHLTTVVGSFHGRVVAARLASEGVPSQLRGSGEGPYPFPAEVEVHVPEELLELAREILLADAVDAAFMESDSGPRCRSRRLRRRSR